MARIRTVKPEFWEDEIVGMVSREARLLFIASFNLADDEGLLRWTPAYIKASAFMYDDDLAIPDVAKHMTELTDAGLLFPYIGGVARQQMAAVVNFRKHQKVNRPQPSKLPPPSLQNPEVRRMYGRRDNWTCHLCGGEIPEMPVQDDRWNLSIGHLKPQSEGGTDHPSNVRAAHQSCNKGRGNRDPESFTTPWRMQGMSDSRSDAVTDSLPGSLSDSVNESNSLTMKQGESSTQREINSLNDSLNSSLPNSLPEGKGREGKGREEAGAASDSEQPTLDGAPVADADKPRGTPAKKAPKKPNKHATADELCAAFWERHKANTAQSFIAIRGIVRTAMSNGLERDDVARALDLLARESRAISGGTLQTALQQIRRPLQAVAGDYQPYSNPVDQSAYENGF